MRAYSLRVGPDPGWLMPCWELEDSADTQRGEGHLLTEAETRGDTSPRRGTPRTAEARGRKSISPRVPKKEPTANTLVLDFWPPELGDSLSLRPDLWCFATQVSEMKSY